MSAIPHWAGMALIPRVSVAWQHAFGDVTPTAALSFQSIGSGFNILGVPIARDAALVEARRPRSAVPDETGDARTGTGDGRERYGRDPEPIWKEAVRAAVRIVRELISEPVQEDPVSGPLTPNRLTT